MTSVIPLILTLLSPLYPPVSGGKIEEFRYVHGLVPWGEWVLVEGLPFSADESFTEVTYAAECRKTFRVLSSGNTAGLRASTGSFVSSDGYAGFLAASDFSLSICDFGDYALASSWKGITIDYREEGGLQGEYRSETILLAGGKETFTAGISPEIAENVRFGPSWCQDSRGGRLWVQGAASRGSLMLSSGGAVTESGAVYRASAAARSGNFALSAGYDDSELFGSAGLDPLFLIHWPRWGFSSVVNPSRSLLLCLSHKQGGLFRGEVQISIMGVSGGVTLNRLSGGDYHGGFSVGINL